MCRHIGFQKKALEQARKESDYIYLVCEFVDCRDLTHIIEIRSGVPHLMKVYTSGVMEHWRTGYNWDGTIRGLYRMFDFGGYGSMTKIIPVY